MSERRTANIPASVRQRLLSLAREQGADFGLMLTNFAVERFLYRLSISPHKDDFVLKGAVLLRVWSHEAFRPTRDLDMLGFGDSSLAEVRRRIQEICEITYESDGVTFSAESVQVEEIRAAQEYGGVRVRLVAHLAGAKIPVQINVGFGDAVVPAPVPITFPVLLDLPEPHVRSYTMESLIAEKFHAMVSLGELNSRMKDFYDIWLLSRGFDFEGGTLAEAIRRTMRKRGISLSDEIVAFSEDFARSKQAQWAAFRSRLGREEVPADFAEIASAVSGFLHPIALALSSGAPPPDRWTAPGPWLHP